LFGNFGGGEDGTANKAEVKIEMEEHDIGRF
jgi:hypothetical protein